MRIFVLMSAVLAGLALTFPAKAGLGDKMCTTTCMPGGNYCTTVCY